MCRPRVDLPRTGTWLMSVGACYDRTRTAHLDREPEIGERTLGVVERFGALLQLAVPETSPARGRAKRRHRSGASVPVAHDHTLLGCRLG